MRTYRLSTFSFLQSVALLFLTSLLFACASSQKTDSKSAELSLENKILQEKNQQLAGELIESKNVAARLQMELVEKQVQINKACATPQGISGPDISPAPQVSVHPQGRMPPPNSKAEAVTCLAEVETEINILRESSAGDKEPQDFSKVDELLSRSKDTLATNGYDEACVLAYEALAVTREERQKAAPTPVKKVPVHMYSDFLEPVRVRTVKRCNIRSRPSTRSKVLEVLEADATLTAFGYWGNWIKVTAGEQTGWINFSLLAVPNFEGYGEQH